MDKNAVINPVSGKESPKLGSLAIMSATTPDLNSLLTAFKIKKEDKQGFFVCNLWVSSLKTGEKNGEIAIAGPFTGAPHAAMVMENLIACGVEKIIFSGWCGAVSSGVKIGDVIIPDGAFSDEGTSKHYGDVGDDLLFKTSWPLTSILQGSFKKRDIPFHSGFVWSTDAIYRETRQKIEYYQKKDVLAVEMELSALIAIAMFRGVDIASVQVVSDDVSSFSWQPGFANKKFKKNRRLAADIIADACMEIINGKP